MGGLSLCQDYIPLLQRLKRDQCPLAKARGNLSPAGLGRGPGRGAAGLTSTHARLTWQAPGCLCPQSEEGPGSRASSEVSNRNPHSEGERVSPLRVLMVASLGPTLPAPGQQGGGGGGREQGDEFRRALRLGMAPY